MDNEYKIIGGDGAEYGPAALDELKNWIRDGRVAAMTKVWRSDLSAWSPAGRYAELREDLTVLHTARIATNARAATPAGFWSRLAAYIIDFFLITVLAWMVWAPLADTFHWKMPQTPADLSSLTLEQYNHLNEQFWQCHLLPVLYLVFLFYSVMFVGRYGATPGKMAIHARIVMVDGSPVGYRRAAWRWLACRCSEMMFFLGYAFILARPDKRGLHDLLVGTRVIHPR